MLSVKPHFLSSSWNTLALTRSEICCEVQVCSVSFCISPISLPSTLSDHIQMSEPSVDTAAWNLHHKIHMEPCHLFLAPKLISYGLIAWILWLLDFFWFLTFRTNLSLRFSHMRVSVQARNKFFKQISQLSLRNLLCFIFVVKTC